jgi:7-carboxy-7-deazaguanine synthase
VLCQLSRVQLRITEIFMSLQGESRFAGLPCAFVRLTGCNLRCTWCDTTYSFHGGSDMSLDSIVERVESYGTKRVEITGGEPLLQKNVYPLMQRFLALGYEVLLETGGSLSIADVPAEVCRVVDVKCPGSGEVGRFFEGNYQALTAHDEVKLVVRDRADFEFAVDVVRSKLPAHVRYSFSPVHGVLHPRELAEWMLESKLDGRLNLQLHKYLWGNEPGR